MAQTPKTLAIDPDLYTRLSVLAAQQGISADELVAEVLAGHVDTEEAARIEHSHLEYRWQKYLETGQTVPEEKIRAKLQRNAADAARRMEV